MAGVSIQATARSRERSRQLDCRRPLLIRRSHGTDFEIENRGAKSVGFAAGELKKRLRLWGIFHSECGEIGMNFAASYLFRSTLLQRYVLSCGGVFSHGEVAGAQAG